MTTPEIARISGRLKQKRESGETVGNKSVDFEYTPLYTRKNSAKDSNEGQVFEVKIRSPEIKQPESKNSVVKNTQGSSQVQSAILNQIKEDRDSTTPVKRGRGRPPKAKLNTTLERETPPSTHTPSRGRPTKEKPDATVQSDTPPSRPRGRPPKEKPDATVQSDTNKKAPTTIKNETLPPKPQSKPDDILKLLEGGLGKNDVTKQVESESELQLFARVASLLPTSLISVIPGGTISTLNDVAEETGVHWLDHGEDVKVIYGSIEGMLAARETLSKLITVSLETQTTATEQMPGEDALDSLQMCDNMAIDVPAESDDPLDGVNQRQSGNEVFNISIDRKSYTNRLKRMAKDPDKCPKHKITDCSVCTVKCDMCPYRSTEVAIRKHKQRMHAAVTFDCEVCGQRFGIRYDMRRHRLIHFDSDGNLTKGGKESLSKNMPDDFERLKSMNLGDLEIGYEQTKVNTDVDMNVAEKLGPSNHGNGEIVAPQPEKQNSPQNADPASTAPSCPAKENNPIAVKKGPTSRLKVPPKETHVLYKCGICERIFKTRASLQMHFKSHEDKEVLTCNLCSFKSTHKGLLNAHLRKKHAAIQERQCNYCDKVFTLVSSLRFHLGSVHGIGAKTQECHICKKTFKTKRFLQVHIKRMHQKILKYFCSMCGKGFFERARMREHENVHLPTDIKEQNKAHVCSYCGKAYSQRGTLRQHENIHKGIRPYKCKKCDKAFHFTAELHKHQMAHTNERPHTCSYCGKGFKFHYKLMAHLVTHTKQGRHFCHICGKVYTALGTLRKHSCKYVMDREVEQSMVSATEIFSVTSDADFVDDEKTLVIVPVKHEDGIDIEEEVTNMSAILGEVKDTDLVVQTQEVSDVIPVASADIQQIVDTIGIVQGNSLDGSTIHIQALPEISEQVQSSIVYMCCICSKLFNDQAIVNAHMVDEHGAEAVLSQEQGSESIHEVISLPEGTIIKEDTDLDIDMVTEIEEES